MENINRVEIIDENGRSYVKDTYNTENRKDMNCTFDIETLGNTSNAPIVQIAAVVFGEKGEIIDSIDLKADLATIPENDFHVDYDTLRWWMNQIANNPSLIDVMNEQIMGHEEMIVRFSEWVSEMTKKYEQLFFWSHATFDPPILDRHNKAYGIERLPFRNQRDIRTLTHIAGYIKVTKNKKAHDAMADCEYQARYIAKGLKILKDKGLHF